MDRPKTLYEPALVKRWAERYRDFECEEAGRRLKELRRLKDLFRKDIHKDFQKQSDAA